MSKAGTSGNEGGEQPTLEQRVAAARQAETQAQMHLASLEERIKAHVEAREFGEADALQQQLPDAQHAWIVAKAEAGALEGAIAEIGRREQERQASVQAERRRQQASDTMSRAGQRQQQLEDELQAIRAEIVAGLEAVRATMLHGYEIEDGIKRAIREIWQARVDLGEATGVPGHISGPNWVSSYVEASPVLTAIRYGTALPA